MPNDFMKNTEINTKDNKFPYCVVFSYLPCASTFIPIVGHVGICTSSGVIHDFSGSYTISVDNMEFSDPMKYWQLDKNKLPLSITDKFYDEAIYQADEVFSKRKHNLFVNNCHHHVAMVLNNIKYKGKSNWTPFKVVLHLVIHSHFVSWKYFFVLYGPFLFILLLLVFLAVTY
ncbi:conserved protein, unknown function [Plasmodium knowlesi strain H]|uniref:PPPDE peptidase n=3 Tax=Plasmodium knowlesi TaxID=5850 RepID=A0A5K1V209_PLAKH|nr:conserved protein, unknown function [Plasmodium knowlesi strain H]OTN66929.1 Uncharacterized protein PKNOH_S07466700 [Plasmodium knowlesi]CAA9988791.1 conserved protein, unknown function [Plasmodium knowlesi strain H]SBO21756.1 conserved protein, unknown function [Plasmodium knowlesi strain H]SBO22145.1 conserved protein, unknown function [Plasmodium knowlesi strain H]VVS78265.1 conserved protein, unknown function [Plasmodium knowlesi strain H]|eukprot:XP_002259768.1 hypothetical protein, conserved [Plasmodium knowlesi strain H]